MPTRQLKDLEPGDQIVWIAPMYTHGTLWRNEGVVMFVNDYIISCEMIVDRVRTVEEFSTDTGIASRGIQYGWVEILGSETSTTKHVSLNRYQVEQLLWQAKQAFLNEDEREQQRILKIFMSGIQEISRVRPLTRGPVYQRTRLIEELFYAKAPRGARGDLPDVFLDYITLS